ncbi:kelch-like protein 3 [Eurytemora carolleeae]|uniref:kelch-like protein 3 n=1 Tax=Eurytemora carolleeae TaxID=1294199 RepID=UPI000C76B13E|nr:kelch-like protein 3 [Eurytemora carolleeae]|eukprot:XP_023348274.1 kelch-like protein 3 [Eurytemora affinis]
MLQEYHPAAESQPSFTLGAFQKIQRKREILDQQSHFHLAITVILISYLQIMKMKIFIGKQDLGSAIMNGDIYSCGGLRGYITPALKDCQKNVRGHWEKAPSMNTERAGFSMTTLGDSIIAAGGFNSRGIPLKTTKESGKSWGMIPLDSIELFDGNSWKNLTNKLPRPIGSHCAVSISDTEILFIGGENIFSSRSNDIISSVIHFDINDGFTGKQIPNMKYTRKKFGCAMFKGEVYVAGGDVTEGVVDGRRKSKKKTADRTSEILNLETLVWSFNRGKI